MRDVNDRAPSPEPDGAARSATWAAFNIALITLVGSSTLSLSLAVLAPMMMATAGMSPAAFGWVSGAAGLGSVWLYMANSAFTVPLGPIKALMVAVLIAALGAALILSGFYALMIAGAILIGFAYGVTTPSGVQLLADNTPAAKRNRIFSLRQTGVPLGGAIAGIAGSALAEWYGWRTTLVVFVIFLMLASSVLLFAPKHFNESRPRTQFRFWRLFAISNLQQPFRTLADTPGLNVMAFASIGFATVQGIFNAFFVTFLANGLGYDLKLAGLLFALNQALSAAGRVVYGFIADAIGSARIVLCGVSVLSAASALAIASLGSGWSLVALMAVATFSGISVATWNGLFMAETASLAPERASEVSASATFFVFGTYVVIPPLAGLVIIWFGYRAAFVMAALGAVFACVTMLVGWRGNMRRR